MSTTVDPQIVSELQWLLTEWCYLVDHGRAAEVIELFTADGIFDSAGVRSVGRAALSQRFAGRQALERTSRHIWANLRLTPLSPTEFQGEAILTVFRHEGPGTGRANPALVLDLLDRYVQADGRWRIATRTLTRIFHDLPWG